MQPPQYTAITNVTHFSPGEKCVTEMPEIALKEERARLMRGDRRLKGKVEHLRRPQGSVLPH